MLDLFFGVFIFFGGIFTLVYAALAYFRFNQGEFKSILTFVILAYLFAYMYALFSLFLAPQCEPGALGTAGKGLFSIAILMTFLSGRLIYEFSKVFGFAGRGLNVMKKPQGKSQN